MGNLLDLLALLVLYVTLVSACSQPPPEKPTVSFTCGRGGPNNRITGGSEAEKHSIPWQAALTSFWTTVMWMGDNQPFCGGTIISPYHILTAAHCPFVPNKWVQVGEHIINDHNDSSTRHEVIFLQQHL